MHTAPQTFAGRLMRDLLSRIHVQCPTGDLSLQKAFQGKENDYVSDLVTDFDAAVGKSLDLTLRLGNRDHASQDTLSRNAARRLTRIPLKEMILAARFANCFATPSQLSSVLDPQALSCITIRDHNERRRTWKELPDILRQIVHMTEEKPESRTPLETAVLGYRGPTRSDQKKAEAEFREVLEDAIEKGCTIIAIVPSVRDLPQDMRPLMSRSFALPPLSRRMILAILRQTHAWDGGLDSESLVDLLPSDFALAKMPLAQFQSAFHRRTAGMIASRLSEFASMQSQTKDDHRLTLERISLPARVVEFCDTVIADLAAWQSGTVAWSEVPSSACLAGPPGNGKTSLATALAGSAGIPLITTSYADCQRAGHQGDFLRALSDKVEEAIAHTPCVFMIDELDSFTHRHKPGRSSDYVVGIVNGLLEHLTTLNNTPGVIILGATNYVDLVDPAILRPGRFDTQLSLGNPDRAGIIRILEIELGPQASDFDVAGIATRLTGLSGAQVSAVVRDARARARHDGCPLRFDHLIAAVDNIAPNRPKNLSRRIAIHEAGHAVVGHALGLPPPHRLQLTATGGVYEYHHPLTMTLQMAQDHITTLLGGRAAEGELLGNYSSGAEGDLRDATDLAYSMRYRWGMRPEKLISLAEESAYGQHSTEDPRILLNQDLLEVEKVALELIKDNVALINRIADALLEKTELNAKELDLLLVAQAAICPEDR